MNLHPETDYGKSTYCGAADEPIYAFIYLFFRVTYNHILGVWGRDHDEDLNDPTSYPAISLVVCVCEREKEERGKLRERE